MSEFWAALIPLIGILGVAGPISYFLFFRGGSVKVDHDCFDDQYRKPITEDEINKIEKTLAVTVPEQLKVFLSSVNEKIPDSTSVWDSSDSIINATVDYRRGYEGLPKFDNELLYIGDELDACPYVINCMTGKVLKLDKGDLTLDLLEEFESFNHFKNALM